MGNPSKFQIFFANADHSGPLVAERLAQKNIPYIELKDGAWFFKFAGTANEAAEEIGLRSKDPISPGIVVSVANYAGRASADIWEWLKVNWPTDG